jgi:hypothetical protein
VIGQSRLTWEISREILLSVHGGRDDPAYTTEYYSERGVYRSVRRRIDLDLRAADMGKPDTCLFEDPTTLFALCRTRAMSTVAKIAHEYFRTHIS